MVRAQRMVAAPFGDVALPTVDPADIAEVAADGAARAPATAAGVYELTGPAPVSPREQATAIAAALGEPVRFVEQSRAEAREQMLRFMPEPVVDGDPGHPGHAANPSEQRVSPDVERILGRAPRAFAEWATRNAAAFR